MGALLAGITPIWSIDFDPNKPELSFALADSYEQNFNCRVIRQTVQEVAARGFADLPRPDFLLITLSCSHFAACRSHGVAEDESDISAALASSQAIRELHPRGVVIENGPLWKGSESYSILTHTLESSGYEYTVEVLKASDYGVPQERERLIIRALKGASIYGEDEDVSSLVESIRISGWIKPLAGLKQISRPNKAQSSFISSENVAIMVQPLDKAERHCCAKSL
jgi:site-specific DNA-cytosine methylase